MAKPRKPTPEPPRKTAVIYARVSTREQAQEGYSIESQLALLRSYALREGLDVRQEFAEAESAKVAGRTAFRRMLERIRKEKIAAILVEKTDRLYRNISDWVRIDELGVEIHLVKEGEILGEGSRSHQKFMHGIKVLMAKNYSENLSEEAKKGMLEKARQGIWPTKAPLGYLNVSHGSRRIIEPDPDRAGIVTVLFESYASGSYSLASVAEFVHTLGLRTRQGKRVTRSEIHGILRNPVYCGTIRWGGEEFTGKHDALVDRLVYDQCQDVMSGRNQTKAKPASEREFAYRGLFKCGRCGCAISPQRTKGHVYYACTGARGCPRIAVREEEITRRVAESLRGLTIRPSVLELLKDALRESLSALHESHTENRDRLTTERVRLQTRLEKLYEDRIDGVVPESAYETFKLRWTAELASVDRQLTSFSDAQQAYFDSGVALLDIASNAHTTFERASDHRKREMANFLLSNPTITDGKLHLEFHPVFKLILEANQETANSIVDELSCPSWLAVLDILQTSVIESHPDFCVV
jgi:DNA invertase Pin-like site-specific DNA recombinase